MEELKDGVVTLSLSPHSSLIQSMSTILLLPSSPQVQVVDPRDGGSSESFIKLHYEINVDKVSIDIKLENQLQKNRG